MSKALYHGQPQALGIDEIEMLANALEHVSR
jgi:hypothetical protein